MLLTSEIKSELVALDLKYERVRDLKGKDRDKQCLGKGRGNREVPAAHNSLSCGLPASDRVLVSRRF